MSAVIEDSDEKKEAAGDRAMIKHLKHGSVQAILVHGRESEEHEPHMTDTGIGNHLFEIGLGQRHKATVNNARDCEKTEVRLKPACCIRKHRVAETKEPVRAHLQKHTGQNDADRGRGFDVSIWKPRVKGEDGNFDGETEKEGQKDNLLEFQGKVGTADHGHVKGVRIRGEIDRQNTEKHEKAPGEGIKEEFDCRILFSWAAPDADQKIHRNQNHLPEDIKKEKV